MKLKNQQAINQMLRKQRVTEQIKNQELQRQLFSTEGIFPDLPMEYTDANAFKEGYELSMKRSRSFLCSLDILEDAKLSSNAKVLFQIISSLSFVEGYCYASDEYLGTKMGVRVGRVKRYVKELDDYGLIKRDTYGTKLGWRRNIHIQFQFIKDLYFKKEKSKTKR